jgi:3-hydroxyisobutyrate dehydrogenase-like beta-hydroxyacid dehydrogenase
MKIAFLGAGHMGVPMALNVLRAGHQLKAFNRTPEKLTALRQEGATIVNAPLEAVEGVDIAITMLANDEAVRETILGRSPSGVAAIDALPRDGIHMCCSTISVVLSRELAREHTARGQGYVGAPVVGRPEAAAERQLWVMAGGPRNQIERCRPVMEAIGRGISVVGTEPWQAHLTKIATNFMIASMLEAMGEAFALVRKSGMDSRALLEVLNATFASPMYSNYGQKIVNQQFDPAGFRVTLGLKDVHLALEAAQDAAAPLPLASLLRDHFLTAIAHGRETADWSAVSEVAAWNAGLDMPVSAR